MKFLLVFLAMCLAAPVAADTVIAARTIRAKSVLSSADVRLTEGKTLGTYSTLESVVGLEARVALYAGRPIRSGEVGPPAIVERNQHVKIVYHQAGLSIMADGRALGRAGVGDALRVMNLGSRQTVTGRVRRDGAIVVGRDSSMSSIN